MGLVRSSEEHFAVWEFRRLHQDDPIRACASPSLANDLIKQRASLRKSGEEVRGRQKGEDRAVSKGLVNSCVQVVAFVLGHGSSLYGFVSALPFQPVVRFQ